MAKTWFYFRFHHEAMRDEKIRSLTPAQRWLWVAVLTAASKSPIRGYLMVSERRAMTDRELADLANLAVREVTRAMPIFQAEGMVEWDDNLKCWYVPKWDKRQFESDSSTERVRKHRETKRSTTVTGNVSETPLELRAKSLEVGITNQQQQTAVAMADDPTAAAAELVTAAFEILYARRKPADRNPPAHRYVVFKALAEQHQARLAEVNWSVSWTPQLLADWLEPITRPQLHVVPPHEHVIKCETCRDRGHVGVDDRNTAIPCPACKTSEETG